MTGLPPNPLISAHSPGIGGELRVRCEDFAVDEIAAYPALGHGEHLFVRFWKENLDTPVAVRSLARALGVSERDAGYAGMKDRRAITTQWASFFGASPEKAARVNLDGIHVLAAERHPHKLRTGHLRGNRFSLIVRRPSGGADEARRTLAELQRRGCPNYYGDQRFGRNNLPRALAWAGAGGPPRKRFEQKLFASVLQAAVFNRVVAERVLTGTADRALVGDVYRKESTGGLFTTDELEDAQIRVETFDISPTGPMPGPKMRLPTHEVLEMETEAEAALGLSAKTWHRLGRNALGTRRPIRVRPTNVAVVPCEEGLRVAFDLPSGAYATVVMREIMKDRQSVAAERPPPPQP